MDINNIIIDYLQVVLNWPFLGALLLFIFLQRYRKEISKILSRLIKIGGAEFGQADIMDGAVSSTLQQSDKLSRNWELEFYGKVVAQNTKQSLFWLYKTGSSTKVNFFQNMHCPSQEVDINVEQEAQYSILLSNKLIEQDGELFKVSKKGEELLKYFNFI